MTRAAAFTQADVTRAFKGAMKAGLQPGSFEVLIDRRSGALRIVPAATAPTPPPLEDDLDAELREWREAQERRAQG